MKYVFSLGYKNKWHRETSCCNRMWISWLCADNLLANQGFKVELYESRPDICKWNIGPGWSINFTLCHRGRAALSTIGCEEEIILMCVPVYGRMIHSLNGTSSSQHYIT